MKAEPIPVLYTHTQTKHNGREKQTINPFSDMYRTVLQLSISRATEGTISYYITDSVTISLTWENIQPPCPQIKYMELVSYI